MVGCDPRKFTRTPRSLRACSRLTHEQIKADPRLMLMWTTPRGVMYDDEGGCSLHNCRLCGDTLAVDLPRCHEQRAEVQ